MFTENPKLKSLFINHLVCGFTFFLIYFSLFTHDKNNFKSANNIHDILYFTSSTHSSTGYGDVTAKSTLARTVVIAHHLCIVALMVELFYCFLCNK